METLDVRLEALSNQLPQVEALLDIHGVGLYSARVVIGEFGEVDSFRVARVRGWRTVVPAALHHHALEIHGHRLRRVHTRIRATNSRTASNLFARGLRVLWRDAFTHARVI